MDKMENYFEILERRIIGPIEDSDIKDYCTASLLLIFAAIDSLSKITCTDSEYAAVGDRFRSFLRNIMGGNYALYEDRLYKLRCDLVHTGINRGATLSKSSGNVNHLKDLNGQLWINTNKLLDDLKEAIHQIRNDIKGKGLYFQNADRRMQDYSTILVVDGGDEDPKPTPAADIFENA